MNTQHHSSSRGFSLIELLIVAAIIGLVAAIAIPNLVNAIQRGRQARTVADANGIAKAVGMYQQDYAKYPIASLDSDAEVLRPHLLAYMSNYNAVDGWMRAFLYTSTDGDHYTLISYALDGESSAPYSFGATEYFDEDIVVNDGMFLQWPEGVQE